MIGILQKLDLWAKMNVLINIFRLEPVADEIVKISIAAEFPGEPSAVSVAIAARSQEMVSGNKSVPRVTNERELENIVVVALIIAQERCSCHYDLIRPDSPAA